MPGANRAARSGEAADARGGDTKARRGKSQRTDPAPTEAKRPAAVKKPVAAKRNTSAGKRAESSTTADAASKKVKVVKADASTAARRRRAAAKPAATPTAAAAQASDTPGRKRASARSSAKAPRGAGRSTSGAGRSLGASGSAARAAGGASGLAADGKPIHVPGERLRELQREYLERLGELARAGAAPEPADRRFAGEGWQQRPYAWTASLYLLNEEFMKRLSEAVVGGDEKTRERIRFATQQWLAAISPANFLLTNPEAQRRVVETKGESLRTGIGNLLSDLQRGRISQTDETAFEVGVNVATTPGSVVYENDLVQLIQYAPSTDTVGSRPLLMVPPCINKFYILDLQPENSLVAYTGAQGHTVFMVSWKNVHADQGHLTWDDYLERGVIEPMRVVREISGVEHINTLGFCVGGTLLVTAAAVLAARGDDWIESMTLLTSFIDFSRPGSIGVFVDEHQVAYREATIGSGGIMPGRELALTFNYLRPNDLVWNYVVANYLKGEAPPAFDLLYWNADSTNLPGPMYCWYLRHMYLQNELREPGRLICLGVPVDVGEIGVPTYIYASREDHIVPWQGAYESTQLLSGPLRFVLGASGHIAGVINPPSKGKRSHWIGEDLPEDAEEWFARATERPGSWWPDWAQWLSAFAGEPRPAPKRPGNDVYVPIEPAPGRYVRQKAG